MSDCNVCLAYSGLMDDVFPAYMISFSGVPQFHMETERFVEAAQFKQATDHLVRSSVLIHRFIPLLLFLSITLSRHSWIQL